MCSKYRTAEVKGNIGQCLEPEVAVIDCIRGYSRFSFARWLLQADMPLYTQQRIQLVVLYVHTHTHTHRCAVEMYTTLLYKF